MSPLYAEMEQTDYGGSLTPDSSPPSGEARFIAVVDEDSASQRSIFLEPGPSPTRYRIIFVEAVPRELDGWPFIPRFETTIRETLNKAELERSSAVVKELHESWDFHVHGIFIPHLHLGDEPAT